MAEGEPPQAGDPHAAPRYKRVLLKISGDALRGDLPYGISSEAVETGTTDGATVAVGQPPVPPATDDDGNAVAVGLPPVPPAVDDDGNAVAVGQPPVPPTTDD